MNSSINPGNNYKDAKQSAVGMFTVGYSDNYTAATEGIRNYSYEKEPLSSDKQIYELIGRHYNM